MHVLVEIDKILHFNGRTLKDYPPMPIPDSSTLYQGNRLVAEELNYNRHDLQQEFNKLKTTMTDEQREIFNTIMSLISIDIGGIFFCLWLWWDMENFLMENFNFCITL